jgi:indolepyruvate ferredoxin oxidoreductase alpha subunit
MSVQLLLGDEAVAQAAIDAGIGGAFSYPGTPATEIFEYVESTAGAEGRVSARWSANEKVAYEEALGMSYAGRRALVSMKHVGLNVAMDPFVNSALTGVNGGLVIAVCDDPGMHSSQNEQDSRLLADFARVPVFEPSGQQEAYDATWDAFAYSERVQLPVLVRLTTRLAHSRANVSTRAPEPASRERKGLPDANDWTLVPANARRRFRRLVEMAPFLVKDSEESPRNRLLLSGRRGVLATGLAHNYVMEALGGQLGELSLLKIGQYPIPVDLVRRLVAHCDEILVAEEGYPFVEPRLNGLLGVPGKSIKGKLTGDLPSTGELTPDVLALALGRPLPMTFPEMDDLAGRPPQLCAGCPHIDTFKAMLEATSGLGRATFFSDIGCYTLGVMPPFRAVHSCVDMGASIAMAHGAAQAGLRPVLCTIGDSTFSHSGMTPLLGAAAADADMTVLILDNGTTAMTGSQDSLTTGETLLGVLRGLGVRDSQLTVIEPHPKKHAENVEAIRKAVAHRGLSVVVAVRECIHVRRKAAAPATVLATV